MSDESTATDLLHDARKRARAVLAQSAVDAQAILDDAHLRAKELLRQQQLIAENLLIGERFDADDARSQALGEAGVLPKPGGRAAMAPHDAAADDLIERQRAAADALVEAQRLAAATLQQAVERASEDVLMNGQRDAAAILLEAQTVVEDARKRTDGAV